ncbi:hypothetical protein D3C85_1078160 [compost metagenome]
MAGVDPPALAAAQDQALAVHDIHVAREDGHRPVDDVLRKCMVQFKHGFYPWKCSGLGRHLRTIMRTRRPGDNPLAAKPGPAPWPRLPATLQGVSIHYDLKHSCLAQSHKGVTTSAGSQGGRNRHGGVIAQPRHRADRALEHALHLRRFHLLPTLRRHPSRATPAPEASAL